MACTSEVVRASLVQPSAIHGSLSLLRLRNLMKHWACPAERCIPNAVLLCRFVLGSGARHRGVAYRCWAGASVLGSAFFVLDGENGQICK